MAPELIATPGRVDSSSDMYSLGCTLFKLLVGTAPTHPVPALTELRSDVPRSVDQLTRRMLAPAREDRPESLKEVIAVLGTNSGNSNLPLLVAPLCPEAAVVTQTDTLPLRHSNSRIFTRRNALGALAIAGATAGVSMMLRHRLRSVGPKIQTTRWRMLKPVSPSVLLSLGKPEETSCKVLKDDRIQIVSDDLALVHLGRPIAGVFSLRVQLHPHEQHSSGVFFQGQLKRSEEDSVFRFQTVELKLGRLKTNGDQTSRYPDRLAWNLWTATRKGKQLSATFVPLAEIAVEQNADAPTQQLELTIGRRGMPEIKFNGDKLHETMWKFSLEARNHQRVSPAQLPTAFLGQLGLISGKGDHTFVRPQLAYLGEADNA